MLLLIVWYIPPTGKAGASWIRTRKITSRLRGKEPPCWPLDAQRGNATSGGRPAREAQGPQQRGPTGREWAVSEGAKRKMLKAQISWVV